MSRKPVGWRREPARHALAAKGISTERTYPRVLDARVSRYKPEQLTDKEYEQLAQLVQQIDFGQSFSAWHVQRREILEDKASNNDLWYAYRKAGYKPSEVRRLMKE